MILSIHFLLFHLIIIKTPRANSSSASPIHVPIISKPKRFPNKYVPPTAQIKVKMIEITTVNTASPAVFKA